jgi:mannose-1-phosphate guanylyltransferase/mannose-6-phosphate isomerase
MSRIVPVILSGGSGTRLWPLSREHYPKQLLALAQDLTMLQETAMRLDGTEKQAPALVVCNEEHRFLVAEQLRQIDRMPQDILLEPFGRNTAPALTLAALAIAAREPDAVMLVMPADHVIRDQAAFHTVVQKGRDQALAGRLVTFGILPTQPETGYGYIRKGPMLATAGAYEVGSFVEKPDVATASSYLESGEYLWNSGIFMMTAARWLEEIRRFRPDIADACVATWHGGKRDMDFFRIGKEAFGRCPSESIDYAVMEKTDNAVVIPLDAGWSDIGSWSSLWEVSQRDADGNVQQGDVLALQTHNALLIAQHRFVAAVGLEDVIVVETADAVLVAHKDHAQEVKNVVAELKARSRSEHLTHRRVYRPWGHYEGIDLGERFQVKRITVNPGAALSLQMHHHRAEHWIVVKGTARVTRGDEVFFVSENESTFIPLGTQHRLENPGAIPLEIIEVQSGSYLGEDDIVRFEDRYNRDSQS